ncbi:hypothetical protein MMC34_001385 [Xylographa carneopallida]|nr:hypothetical protein [Xylographa carneopallida]
MKEFNEASGAESEDGTNGFIALEIMPINFRLTHAFQERQEICDEILTILEYHGWEKIVLVSHSYGTIISTYMLHDPRIAPRIGPIIYLDPVTWLLHLPEVAYNFTRRIPREANEHQLYYFTCTDIGVAHTLARHFFWVENILWKEEIGARKMTVFLGAEDIIVNTEAVGNYLTRQDGIQALNDHRDSQSWKTQKWSGKGIDVVWLPECDHGEVVDYREYRKQVLDVTMEYCNARD